MRALAAQASRKRLGVFGRILDGAAPQRPAMPAAATGSDNSKPSRPLHARRLSPSPFSVPSSLLYPLTVLYLILLPPIARSVTLFVQGTPPLAAA